MWTVITTNLFNKWLDEQDESTQEKVLAGLVVLQQQGPNLGRPLVDTVNGLYWSSCAGHFYLRIFILQWAHPIVGCMRPFKIVIMNELRDFLFNSVFIHSRSVT